MNQMSMIVPAGAANFKARFTTDEFRRMCEVDAFDDWKIELVDGDLERMQQPKIPHSMRQAQVIFRLMQAAGEALVRGEVGIELTNDTVLACDAAILRAPIQENRWARGDDLLLVVEIAETTHGRDLGMKRFKYADVGIPHYWVVDGQRSVVHIFGDPIDGDYAQISTVRFGEPLAVPGTDATIVIE